MAANSFPVRPVDVVFNFYKTEVLTGEEAKHFTENDLAPSPKRNFSKDLMEMRSRIQRMNRTDVEIQPCGQWTMDNELEIGLRNRKQLLEETQLKMERDNIREVMHRMMYEMSSEFKSQLDESFRKLRVEMEKMRRNFSKDLMEMRSRIQRMNRTDVEIVSPRKQLLEETQLKMERDNIREEMHQMMYEVKSEFKSQLDESFRKLRVEMERMRRNFSKDLMEMRSRIQRMNRTDVEIVSPRKQLLEKRKLLTAQYEKNAKELKNLCEEEEDLKRFYDTTMNGYCRQLISERQNETKDKIRALSTENQQLSVEIQRLTTKAQDFNDRLSAALDELTL